MRRLLALGLGCLVSVTASSEDLLTIFDQAVVNDPQVREAEYTRKATREAKPQAWAAYLPQINGRWTREKDDIARSSVQPFVGPVDPANPAGDASLQFQATNGTSEPTSTNWGLQLSQSIFNWGQLVGLQQAGRIVAQADADYGVAQQSLALRVATAYFDVLASQDNVQAQQASLDAISRQLEQADKRFEVGLIAITDVQEARAARDTAAADLIAAKRALATSQEGLREITSMQYAGLFTPRDTMPLHMPEPADQEKWVQASMDQNLSLTSSRLGADIARDDVRVAFGGHLPQVDLVVGKSHSESDATQTFDPIP
ncbi:MAG TPA: TolC family protein, partial [Steroidobacteraceae bacterium]|nr:TolC family protein [Steroidobacteraceae bacterium]